jgi:hypothetical protein
MLTAWYPTKDTRKVMEINKELPKMPDTIKKWQMLGSAGGNEGNKVYNLIMVEKGATDEALKYITQMQIQVSEKIENYTWKIEPVIGMRDMVDVLSR